MSIKEKTVFVWRDGQKLDSTIYDDRTKFPTICPCCASPIKHIGSWGEVGLGEYHSEDTYRCLLCGWKLWHMHGDRGFPECETIESVLKKFGINSRDLMLDELGSHLNRHFADIYALHWRRFEELMDHMLREHGYQTILTQQSRDGGADIILIERASDQAQAIVECKKFSRDRRVGVSAIRALVGASIEWDVQNAYLITTSDFTGIATMTANNLKSRGFEISLVAGTELLSLLGVYNSKMPSLDNMNESVRREIVRSNEI